MKTFLIANLLISLFLLNSASAKLEFHSEKIKTMDIEILQKIISRNLKTLENRDEAPEPPIRQSLEILLAQPDQSLAASNIYDQLRSQAGSEQVFLNVLESIINEGIGTLKQEGKDKELLREQNTYIYILNNMLAELQRNKDQEFYRNLIEKIRDADIDFSDSLVSHRLLNSMSQMENPSKFAATILPKKKSWWKFW